MAFLQTWNTSFGNNPEDSESRRYGAQQIRNLKDAIVERMQVDHEFGEEVAASGVDDQTDSGYHKRVTIKKVAGGASEAASGYAELSYNSTNDTLDIYPEGGTKQVFTSKAILDVSLSPIGSIIGIHPSVTIAKAIDTDYWLACDGVGTCTFTYSDGTTTTDVSVPDLTDNRFLMGGTGSGTGGSNTLIDHTHACSTDGAHTHSYTHWRIGGDPTYNLISSGGAYFSTNSYSTGSGGNHDHTIGTGSAPSSTDSRPLYFTVLYYMRIK
jgi:hypothetical protein